MTTPWGDMPNLPRGSGRFGIRKYMQTPLGSTGVPNEPGGGGNVFNRPLRLSEIKYSVYGGLRFNRVLYAGWAFSPSIGMVARDIDKLGLELENFLEPLNAAVGYMAGSIERNFQEGGRPDHWDPLADYTVEVRGTSEPILIRSGKLKQAATSFSIWTITGTSASIQSLPGHVWYGVLHQEGYGSARYVARALLKNAPDPRSMTEANISKLANAIGMGKIVPKDKSRSTKFVIPARPFVVFQEPEDIEAIQQIFVEWMESKANDVGRSWNRL